MSGAGFDNVVAAPPNFGDDFVARLIEREYGIAAALEPLVSERDQNYRVTTPHGEILVFKIANASESPVVTDFQVEALLRVERSGRAVAVPRIRPALSGQPAIRFDAGGASGRARMVTWVEGRLLDDGPLTPQLARSLGAILAHLDIALAGFRHAGENQDIAWNMQRAPALQELVHCVTDAGIAAAVSTALDDFERRALPRFPALRSQVIHNDANPNNVVVRDGEAVGIIDFGDMLYAPLVVDVAVAAAYLRTDGDDPLEFLAPLVAGFHAVLPLQAAELDLLFDLVRTRLAMTITLLYWRLSARDENDAYRQRCLGDEADAGAFLARLDALGRQAFRARFGDLREKN